MRQDEFMKNAESETILRLYLLVNKKGMYRFKKYRMGAYNRLMNQINEDIKFYENNSNWDFPPVYKSIINVPRNGLKLWFALHKHEIIPHYLMVKDKKGFVYKRWKESNISDLL